MFSSMQIEIKKRGLNRLNGFILTTEVSQVNKYQLACL